MTKYKHILLCCLCSLVSLFSHFSVAEDTARPSITFICGGVSVESPLFKAASDIYKTAFTALGYDFKMISSPNLKRSLAEANHGGIDGDCARSANLNSTINGSRLQKINVKILETSIAAWSRDSTLVISSADDIRRLNLKVGYLRGTIVTEKFLTTHQISNTLAINTPELAIKMLLAGRYDLLLLSPQVVKSELRRLKRENSVHNVGTLERNDLYPYINERHKALIPQLEIELRKIVPPTGIDIDKPPSPPRRSNE